MVKIGQSGHVKSDLKAKQLVIAGKFHGNAECESIEIVSGGEAEGKLIAASLTIDATSSFQGESIRRNPGEVNVVSITKDDDEEEEPTTRTSPFSGDS